MEKSFFVAAPCVEFRLDLQQEIWNAFDVWLKKEQISQIRKIYFGYWVIYFRVEDAPKVEKWLAANDCNKVDELYADISTRETNKAFGRA